MARVRFCMGPHAGETRHIEFNWIVQLLIDAGLIERCTQLIDTVPEPVVKPQPTWSIGSTRAGTPCIAYRSASGEVHEYAGPSDRAVAVFKRANLEIPDDILKQYRAMFPSASDREAAAERAQRERVRMEDAMAHPLQQRAQ